MTESSKTPTLSVIIPVYNEEKTINKILNLVSEIDIVSEVVIVDDCSKDGSIKKINNSIESISKQKPHIKFPTSFFCLKFFVFACFICSYVFNCGLITVTFQAKTF